MKHAVVALGVLMAAATLSAQQRNNTPNAQRASPHEVALGSLAEAIDYVAAADNYVELHSNGRVTMRRMTLAEAERALAGQGFVRIHRRFLVNRSRIATVSGNGDKMVRLDGGAELPVGRRFAANLDASA